MANTLMKMTSRLNAYVVQKQAAELDKQAAELEKQAAEANKPEFDTRITSFTNWMGSMLSKLPETEMLQKMEMLSQIIFNKQS